MVPSGGAASDGGGGRTTMQQMLRERRPSFSSACAIFSVGPSRMYRFSFFFFFSATQPSLHSRGPGNNLWRLLGRGSGRVAAGG